MPDTIWRGKGDSSYALSWRCGEGSWEVQLTHVTKHDDAPGAHALPGTYSGRNHASTEANSKQSCLRVSDTSRMTYTLTGLAMRLAKSMDLHLENPRLHVSPFENEMRKRLWWSICSLECRSAEEYGFHPTNGGQTYDCSLPLNVNDEDLDPEATEPPEPRSGSTNMTWALVRFELARIIFQVWNLSSKPDKRNSSFDARTMETEKERILDEGNSLLETQYLKHCRSSRAFDWMTATFTRLMIVSQQSLFSPPTARSFSGLLFTPTPTLRNPCFIC